MSAIEIILASIGGTAALVISLGWLSKSFVTHLLDKDILSSTNLSLNLSSNADLKSTPSDSKSCINDEMKSLQRCTAESSSSTMLLTDSSISLCSFRLQL